MTNKNDLTKTTTYSRQKTTGQMNISPRAISIGQSITTGLLLEVSCHPSPGLVSPFSTGSHQDMNFLTFMISTAQISPYFSLCAQEAMEWHDQSSLLDQLRRVGLKGEQDLLNSTGGVNTQRGILFLGGIIAAGAGMLSSEGSPTVEEICKNISIITSGIVERELNQLTNKEKHTHGEKLFLKKGITGIRGEVEAGLPSIREIAYPQFKKAMSSGIGLNLAMVDTLIHLMAKVEDTTVLHRLGEAGLSKTHHQARLALESGSVYTSPGRAVIDEMHHYFVTENISPGGCADLLAATIGLYLLEGNTIKNKDILKDFQENI